MNIADSDLSIVVQGKVTDYTASSLKTMRSLFPRAEIILSTWENDPIEGLSFDILVQSADPGGVPYSLTGECSQINNQNRQVVSTINGLRKASRPYVIKVRTDFTVTKDTILRNFNSIFHDRDLKYAIFNSRIVTCSLCSRIFSHQTLRPTPFHPSDIFAFGERNDLLKLWESVDLASDEELGFWKCKYPNLVPYADCSWRYPPEQFIFVKCIEKHYSKVGFDDWTDYDIKNMELSKRLIINNFIILNNFDIGLESEKHKHTLCDADNGLPGVINCQRFLEFYNDTYQTNFVYNKLFFKTENSLEKVNTINEKVDKINDRLKQEIKVFVSPFKYSFKWMCSISKFLILSLKSLMK